MIIYYHLLLVMELLNQILIALYWGGYCYYVKI